MVTRNDNGLWRVTVTLDPEDVQLLDALAGFEGLNRSAELRGLLAQVRPIMRQLVETFTLASQQRDALDRAMVGATVSELEAIAPEMDEIAKRFMGTLAKLEGHAASVGDAPASNTGATE